MSIKEDDGREEKSRGKAKHRKQRIQSQLCFASLSKKLNPLRNSPPWNQVSIQAVTVQQF